MTSRHHMQTPLTTEAMSHASELSKVAQSIASRPQFSANIKTWQDRREEYYSQSGSYQMRSSEYFKDAEIADLRAAIAAKAVPDGWKPIETAPKDGTRILLYRPLAQRTSDEPIDIKRGIPRDSGCWSKTIPVGMDETNYTDGACKATHWMPLPPPPSPAEPSHE